MNLLKIALAGLTERKARTSIAVAGIGIGIAAYIILTGIADGFQEAVRETHAERGTDIIIYEKDKPTVLTSVIDQSAMDDIGTFPGVGKISGVVMDFMKLEGRRVIVYGWKSDSFLFIDKHVTAGRKFQDGSTEVMLGDIAARNLNKGVGDNIRIGRTQFKIVGIYSSRSLFERGSVLMPIQELQRIKSAKGQLTMVNVVAEEAGKPGARAESLARLKKAIEEKYPDLAAETSQDLFSGKMDILPLVRGIAWAISVVALLIAVFGTMNVIMMSVLEKTREMGILMAVGWGRFRIFRLVVCESLMVSLTGGAAGIVVGSLGLEYLLTFPMLEGLIEARYGVEQAAGVLLAVVAVGFLSAIYPATRAMSLSIVEALRHE